MYQTLEWCGATQKRMHVFILHSFSPSNCVKTISGQKDKTQLKWNQILILKNYLFTTSRYIEIKVTIFPSLFKTGKEVPENGRWICRTQISHSLEHVSGFVLEGDTPLSHFHTNYKHKCSPNIQSSDYETALPFSMHCNQISAISKYKKAKF